MPMAGRTIVSEASRTILLCIDSYEDMQMKGQIHHCSLKETKRFSNLMQMLLQIEELLNDTGYPRSTTERRRFTHSSPNINGVNAHLDKDHLNFQAHAGQLATFKLKIMFRQYASWQGCVSWVERSSEEPFRSALELVMLMDSALHQSE